MRKNKMSWMKWISYIFNKLVLILIFKNWYLIPFYVLNVHKYIRINKKLVMRNGYKIAFEDFHSLWPFKEVFLDNAYRLYPSSQELVILDLGANIGAFTLFASKTCPNSKIFSFEPSKSSYKILMRNLKNNGLVQNVSILNKAVGNRNAIRSMDESRESTMRRLSDLTSNRMDSTKVEVIKLDQFITNNSISVIDFMKIDIEGGEYEVIYSISKSMFKKIKTISLEYHNENRDKNGKTLQEYLENNGYFVIRTPENSKVGLIYASR